MRALWLAALPALTVLATVALLIIDSTHYYA